MHPDVALPFDRLGPFEPNDILTNLLVGQDRWLDLRPVEESAAAFAKCFAELSGGLSFDDLSGEDAFDYDVRLDEYQRDCAAVSSPHSVAEWREKFDARRRASTTRAGPDDDPGEPAPPRSRVAA